MISLKSDSVVAVNPGTWISAVWSGILLTCHCWLSVVALLVFLIRTFLCSWIQQDLIPFAPPASSTFLEIVKGVKVGQSTLSEFFPFSFFIGYILSSLQGPGFMLCVLCPSPFLSLGNTEKRCDYLHCTEEVSKTQSWRHCTGYWLVTGEPGRTTQACRTWEPVLSPAWIAS